MIRNYLLFLILLINFLVIFLIFNKLPDPTSIILSGSFDENSLAEFTENDDWWSNLNDLFAFGEGDFIALTVLFVITLHLVLMRGCARFIVNYFRPFYVICIPLLIAILTINLFELTYLDGFRNICLIMVGGIITAMAFLTPIYFMLCNMEDEAGTDRKEEVHGYLRDNEYEQSNREDTPPPPPYDAPNYALVRQRDNTDIDCPGIVASVSQVQKDVSLVEEEVATKSDKATEPTVIEGVLAKDITGLEGSTVEGNEERTDANIELSGEDASEDIETKDEEFEATADENNEVETGDSEGIRAGNDERVGLKKRKHSRRSTFFK